MGNPDWGRDPVVEGVRPRLSQKKEPVGQVPVYSGSWELRGIEGSGLGAEGREVVSDTPTSVAPSSTDHQGHATPTRSTVDVGRPSPSGVSSPGPPTPLRPPMVLPPYLHRDLESEGMEGTSE